MCFMIETILLPTENLKENIREKSLYNNIYHFFLSLRKLCYFLQVIDFALSFRLHYCISLLLIMFLLKNDIDFPIGIKKYVPI